MNPKMRIVILLLSVIGVTGGLSQEAAGTNPLEIVWAVPTNHVPPSAWVYKITPQTFTSEVVSNLMVLGSFTTNDETHLMGQPPLSRYFNSKDGTRKLGMVPTHGFIFYYDSAAESKGHNKAFGVPSEEEAARLGAEYLQKFGIERSQIVTVGDNTNSRLVRNLGSRSWFDKTFGTNVETVYMRGAFFVRCLDGIPFDGIVNGGMHIEFGDHAKVSRLEILWKGLEPYKLHSTLRSAQLVEKLRSGNGKWVGASSGRSAKKTTVYDAQLLYRGFPIEEDEGNEHIFLEPFARLKTHIDTGSTNIAADFDCPIIDETVLK